VGAATTVEKVSDRLAVTVAGLLRITLVPDTDDTVVPEVMTFAFENVIDTVEAMDAVAAVLNVTVSGLVEVSTAVTVVPVAIPVPLTGLPTETDDASAVVTTVLVLMVHEIVTADSDTVSPTAIAEADDAEETMATYDPDVTATVAVAFLTVMYVGDSVGETVGALLGLAEGSGVGLTAVYVGTSVGLTVGADEGAALGCGVGLPTL